MESKEELKETDIKNRTCYYFDDIIRDIDFDFNNNLLDKKSCNVYISYFNGCKAIAIRNKIKEFNKIDQFIKIYNEIRYLVSI